MSKKPGYPGYSFTRSLALIAALIAGMVSGTPMEQNYGQFGIRILYPDTPLREAVIVSPDCFMKRARDLAERIEDRTGTRPELVDESQAGEGLWGRNLILLGHYGNNRFIARLYGLRLTPVDGWYPGAGGFLLHSVCDPFGKGLNAIVAGFQDEEGAQRAVDAFAQRIQGRGEEAVFPWSIRSKITAGTFRHASSALTRSEATARTWSSSRVRDAGALFNGYRDMCVLGDAYAFSGDEAAGAAYARQLKAFAGLVAGMGSMPPGSLSGWSPMFNSVWRLLEPSPLFTEADRAAITAAYARVIEWDMNQDYVSSFAANHAKGELPLLRRNKYIFSSFGIYLGQMYFSTYFPSWREIPRWRELAETMFARAESVMCMDDAVSYFFHVPLGFLRYAAAAGDGAMMDELVRMARLLTMFVDPLGENTQVGDGNLFGRSSALYWGHSAILNAAAQITGDPLYAGVVEKVRGNEVGLVLTDLNWPLFMFTPGTAGSLPETVNAIESFPLDDAYYRDIFNPHSEMYYASGRQERAEPPNVALEESFFKMVWREGWGTEDQYMMLDGVDGAIHNHLDGNTVNSLADLGRIWLADRSYTDRAESSHNGLVVMRDGNYQPRSYLVALDTKADLGRIGYTATTCRDYGGTDWTRHIFWNKGEYFFFLDEVKFNHPGEYVLQNYWHVLGDVRFEGESRAVSRQRDRSFALVNGDGAGVDLQSRRVYAENLWGRYPYFASGCGPDMTRVRQTRVLESSAGEREVFANLLIAGEGAPEAEITQTGPFRFTVKVYGEETKIFGLHGLDGSDEGLRTDAAAYVFSSDRLSLAGVTRLELNGREISFPEPAEVELNAAESLGEDYAAWFTQAASLPPVPGRDDQRRKPAEGVELLSAQRVVRSGDPVTSSIIVQTGSSAAILTGTSDGRISAWDPESGAQFWEQTVGSAVNDLTVANLGGTRKVAVALADWRVKTFGLDGVPGWEKQMPTNSVAPQGLRGISAISAAGNAAGTEDLVFGTAAMDVYRLDSTGEVLWRESAYHRGIHALTTGDYNGDGTEQAAVGMEISIYHVETGGKLLRMNSSSRGNNWKKMHTARLDAGRPVLLAGSDDGRLDCHDPVVNRTRWFARLGGEISAVTSAGPSDPVIGVFAGIEGMYVYGFDRDGRERWRQRLSDRVETLCPVAEGGEAVLLAGTSDGGIWVLDAAQGTIRAHRTVEGPVVMIGELGSGACAAVTSSGDIWVFDP